MLLVLIARPLIGFRFLCTLTGSHGAQVGVDHCQHIVNISQNRICLNRPAPIGQLRVKLPRNLAVNVNVIQKRLERTPRESAPDVFQTSTCFDQQVFFYRLTVIINEPREAYDSPRPFFWFWLCSI